jgi:hypothetical protein
MARFSLAAGLTFASVAPAAAATQVFDIDIACAACGVSPSFGSITVTEIVNDDLAISVNLAPVIFFHRNQNGNQHALAFSLHGNPTIQISALSDTRWSSTFTGNVGAELAELVPEAATWAMILIGFLGLGWVSRRRPRVISAV